MDNINNMKVGVTVFTPTYNRAYILQRLFNSLENQTCYDFEWIIVDDGSIDETRILAESWIKKTRNFSIFYYYKENGGKHRAINLGLDKSSGRLFFIVDSDDYLTPDAIETILELERNIENVPDKIAGLGFNRGTEENKLIGKTFKGYSILSSSIDRARNNIYGDKAEVFYTDILKNFKFPEFENEKFLTENVVWYKIANEGYKIQWFNKIIYICEYLNDGLSRNASNLILKNYLGYTYTIKTILKYKLTIKEKFISIGVYTRISRVNGVTYKQISKNIDQNKIACFILGNLSMLSYILKNTIRRFGDKQRN